MSYIAKTIPSVALIRILVTAHLCYRKRNRLFLTFDDTKAAISKRRLRIKILSFALAACISIISMPEISTAAVAVTFPPLGGLIRMLDPQVQIIVLLPSTADPHHFQMTPKSSEALQRATLFVRASRDDGGWSGLHSPADTLDLWPNTSHAWTSPNLVRIALPRLAKALGKLYPSQRSTIHKNLNTAIATTRKIEKQWLRVLAPYRADGVIMQHPSWQPLCKMAGVPVLAVLESHKHGQEFGPRDLDRALKIIDHHPNVLLIAEQRHSNQGLDWLASHSHHPVHMITFDALGTNDMNWADLMQDNLKRLHP